MYTPLLEEQRFATALVRNEAFLDGQPEEYPLIWLTVLKGKPGPSIPEPANEEELWTDVDSIIK